MDSNNFAGFSNSWSYGSDVKSEESISNKNRDYTSEFTTNQIFENREDMLNWAKMIGLENGIVVVIKNSTKKIGGKMPKCILACERGGKYKHSFLVEGTSEIKNTGTKKCECPFELRGRPIPPEGVMWGLKVICGIHNHKTAEFMDGHEYPSRLKPMEKQLVMDMANSTAPREILSILKQKDSSNITGIKSIYNIIGRSKSAKRGGLNQVQYVLEQLIKKGYLHDYCTNPDTNEITDILWVHPKSLALAVNFSSVFIIDATYKTNEYRSPLLEVVGITSTMRTYSLMFAYLSHERVENLTWALNILKRLMVEKGATLPSVFVSDRDLALINAIGVCFPLSHHILCIWHINQCVLKKCRPMLGLEWNKLFSSWHSLINSSTESSYHQKWKIMLEEYQRFQRALTYLWETWLQPHREQFVSAWIDLYMHLGSNSSQRAEGAHARLKMYLGDTMSSLDTSFDKIHKMLTNQFGDIQKSFETSLHIPRHAHLHDNIFSEVRCHISLEAMEIISDELKCVDDMSYQSVGNCNCAIRKIYGLPCKHDLAYYRHYSIPIPIISIHAHWRRLSMHVYNRPEESQRNKTSHVVEILDKMNPEMRDHMIDRFLDMADPSQSTVRVPSYNIERKGRPSDKDSRKRRRMPSFVDISTSGSGVNQKNVKSPKRGRYKRGSGVCSTTSTNDHSRVPSTYDIYINQLPVVMHHYISDIVDVAPDDHCGFRAIAALIGYGEEGWMQVRFDLIDEIQQNKAQYDVIFPDNSTADNLLVLLNYFETPATERHWMEAMTLGTVIASRYNIVLHTFGGTNWSCFTRLPLRSPPVKENERMEIAIGHVGNHFVQLFLHPYHPVPPVSMWWWDHSSYESKGCASSYKTHTDLWREIISTGSPGAQFGGNID
ncbi:unnamed protein product [Rhodiola kirilowii]